MLKELIPKHRSNIEAVLRKPNEAPAGFTDLDDEFGPSCKLGPDTLMAVTSDPSWSQTQTMSANSDQRETAPATMCIARGQHTPGS
jgi:hypothetical protein